MNQQPNQPNVAPDFTTPAAIICATLLAIAMIAAVVLGPGDIRETIMPVLFILLTTLVGVFGVTLNKKLSDTHVLVNSQMTAFREETTRAKELALDTSQKRIAEVAEAAHAAGHAAGLEAGRAEAVTALTAAVTVVPASPPMVQNAPPKEGASS